ncbi:hypothetical protein [Kordiimonas sp.]|uniref:hypothetical protein n=1 Tax=Kordiimonas sp. TaxID=1970157 RepID=UPI003A94A26F
MTIPHSQRHSAAMSENPFIHKRQRQRAKKTALLSTRNIFGLIAVMLAAYAAFRLWVGDPTTAICEDGCESLYSLAAWVLGFFMLFAAVIAAGAAVGLLVAFIRRRADAGESAITRMQENEAAAKQSPAQGSDQP